MGATEHRGGSGMTADLRRLAEQALPFEHTAGKGWVRGNVKQNPNPVIAYIAAANPQAILALLEANDALDSENNALEQQAHEAERRVAALEEGLRQLAGAVEWMFAGTDELVAPGPMQKAHDKARALLASGSAGGIASPSEPPEHFPVYKDGAWRCDSCGAILTMGEWVPAALTSASAEAEGLPAEVGEPDGMTGPALGLDDPDHALARALENARQVALKFMTVTTDSPVSEASDE